MVRGTIEEDARGGPETICVFGEAQVEEHCVAHLHRDETKEVVQGLFGCPRGPGRGTGPYGTKMPTATEA